MLDSVRLGWVGWNIKEICYILFAVFRYIANFIIIKWFRVLGDRHDNCDLNVILDFSVLIAIIIGL